MTKKTAASKARAPKANASVSVPDDKAASNVVALVPETAATEAGAVVRVRDLVDRVAEASDQKKKDVRDVVEAVLAVLGKAIDAGEVLNLPPLGKLRVARAATAEAGAITLKLRRGGGGKGSEKAEKEGLAEDGEDS